MGGRVRAHSSHSLFARLCPGFCRSEQVQGLVLSGCLSLVDLAPPGPVGLASCFQGPVCLLLSYPDLCFELLLDEGFFSRICLGALTGLFLKRSALNLSSGLEAVDSLLRLFPLLLCLQGPRGGALRTPTTHLPGGVLVLREVLHHPCGGLRGVGPVQVTITRNGVLLYFSRELVF